MKLFFRISLMIFAVTTVSCKKNPVTSEADKLKADSLLRETQLTTILSGFDTRVNSGFQAMKGTLLTRAIISPPISASGVFYTRDLSYSLVDFAAKCFWLEEQNQAANDAIIENCNIYIPNIEALRDRDQFYWSADVLCRIVELFGTNGTRKPGLLSKAAEDKVYEVMWLFAKDQSKLTGTHNLGRWLFVTSADFSTHNTWDIEASENHNIQGVYARWHFSKLLKDHSIYRTRNYDDGSNAAAHFNAWTLYMEKWILERAKKGLFIEMGHDAYNMDCLKGIYGFFDYGPAKLKDLSKKFLDLYWATWAQEQINGVSGGSKARVYPGRESIIGATHFRKLAWYYFGIGEPSVIRTNIFSFITSAYRIPNLITDIATDTRGKGNYEIIQRRLGLAKDGFYNPPMYRINQTDGLIRYSYNTPDFIMGTFHCEALPEPNWTMISSQNRWAGIIFNGNPNSRIFPECAGTDNRVYNQMWGVQSKGTMITHKLLNNVHSRDAAPMRVWISDFGLTSLLERDGWVFVASQGAYAALRAVQGSYTWNIVNEPGLWSGRYMAPTNQYSPIIMEVGQKDDYPTYKAFQDKVIASKLTINPTNIQYEGIYGDKFQFFTDYSKLPTVNGSAISLKPTKVMSSPFVNSDFDSGIYTIRKGSKVLNLNFN